MQLELTEKELLLIGEALGKEPFNMVAQLIQNIQKQYDAQSPNDGMDQDVIK